MSLTAIGWPKTGKSSFLNQQQSKKGPSIGSIRNMKHRVKDNVNSSDLKMSRLRVYGPFTRAATHHILATLKLYLITIISILCLYQNVIYITSTQAISIKPQDFDRLVMPCYSESQGMSVSMGNPSYQSQQTYRGYQSDNRDQSSSYNQQFGSISTESTYSAGSNGAVLGSNFAGQSMRSMDLSYNSQNGRFPRAASIENFIALVSKIEAALPRLASSPDQMIRLLLERFRTDNFYYDTRSRVHVRDSDHRINNIIPAILNARSNQYESSLSFPENLLDTNDKCALYFMLSHFIDKTSSTHQPLGGIAISQINPPSNRNPPLQSPYLQAAGSGYPSKSANQAYGGSSGNNPSYPGPSNGFGSPATQNMASFGSGLGNNPESSGKNPYGINTIQPNPLPFYQRERNTLPGSYPSDATGTSRQSTRVLIDGELANSKDDMTAIEYGVVTVGNQENSALVLNRVLMGILAADTSVPTQTIEQLAHVIYPYQALTQTSKLNELIDPLFAVTLADLWAVSSILKPGKRLDVGQLDVAGHWNDSMCPLTFKLDRSKSIKFTSAELAGGLDGFNLGSLRRKMLERNINLRLSDMLRMYYNKDGFRHQFGEFSVCNRGSTINMNMENLFRQAESYLRLHQMDSPISDLEISKSIRMVSTFANSITRVASNVPLELCAMNDLSGDNSGLDQCEIGKSDAVTLLDTSPEANTLFMKLVVHKLAFRLGLSRNGNRLSILTNQQNMAGMDGFNAILRNSTNIAEVGCALTYDSTTDYSGGHINEPARLMEMFEKAFIALDTEYLVRQTIAQGSNYYSGSRPTGYYTYSPTGYGETGEDTGGSKVLIWFNHGQSNRPSQIANSPTNWYPSGSDQNQYKFQEAKSLLHENYRGAAILVVSNDREGSKQYVFDEDKDMFTDLPTSSGLIDISYKMNDPSTVASMSGQVSQLVDQLMQRMCQVPAVFQYPRCFRGPSESVIARGFISPGKRQYWMMAPKTFFASQTVKMLFRVEGGRLRVCFGRMPHPEESGSRYNQQSGNVVAAIASSGQSQVSGPNIQSTYSSANNYYTGMEYGVCKEVSSGQQIDFIVDTPCYHKSIAECMPFYFDIKELSYGERDINYMCRDEGCKRLDQVKFTMTHTGVYCSAGLSSIHINWLLAVGAALLPSILAPGHEINIFQANNLGIATILLGFVGLSKAQQAGVYDFGQGRSGEKRDQLTPVESHWVMLVSTMILAGLVLSCGLCYFVAKRRRQHGRAMPDDERY